MSNYVVCVPVYKVTRYTHKFFNSFKDYENLVIVDNTGIKACQVFEKKGARVLYQEENIGVGRAWNLVLKMGYDWTFLVSSSMMFVGGFKQVAKLLADYDGEVLRTDHSWHCIGISKSVVDKIGYIDQNFYPGYLEDCDYDYRIKLCGIQEFPTFTIDAVCQRNGGATTDGAEVRIWPMRKYFVKKWGGPELVVEEGAEFHGVPTVWSGESNLYTSPFNDSTKKLSYWRNNSISTLKKKYGLWQG